MIGPDHKIWKQYEEMGQRWLEDEIEIESFEGFKLNPKQKAFVNSKDRFTLISGGFASGKTTAFVIKLALLCMWFPGNRVLLGRKTRKLVETMTLPDVFDVFPKGLYQHNKGPGEIEFGNESKILFWGLDASQTADGGDIKKAEQDIKSLNLGAVFIDQLEEVEESIFDALTGRMRRDVGFQQMNMTTNPANFWGYQKFKVEDNKNHRLIESSMLDNKEHLSEEYLEDQLSKSERYVQRYVYGNWDKSILVDGGVFADEHLDLARNFSQEPVRKIGGIKVYREPEGSVYQIGVDPSSGAVDPCYITCVDMLSGEQVASFSDYIPLHAIAEKVKKMADMYTKVKKPRVIVEVQGGGEAIIEKLKDDNYNLYQREVFAHRENKKKMKLGWHTNHSTKLSLIDNMINLLDDGQIKIRDEKVADEMMTFVWNNTGAAAQTGNHDDAIMATMLAYWDVEPKSQGRQSRIKGRFAQQQQSGQRMVYNKYT